MSGKNFDVEFPGTNCRVELWDDREYLNFISSIWKKQLKDAETKTGEVDPLKISMIAGLQIVDKLVKGSKTEKGDLSDSRERVHDLIGKLDSVLFDE